MRSSHFGIVVIIYKKMKCEDKTKFETRKIARYISKKKFKIH